GEGQEDEAEGEGEGELAFAGLERDGGGQDAGLADNVAADHQRGADFGDSAAKAGRYRDQDLSADHAGQFPGDARLGGAVGAQGIDDFGVEQPQGRTGQAGHDRN